MLLSGLFTALFGLGYFWNIHVLWYFVLVQVRASVLQLGFCSGSERLPEASGPSQPPQGPGPSWAFLPSPVLLYYRPWGPTSLAKVSLVGSVSVY